MSTFQARVEDRAGTISDTTALSNWLTSGARRIVDLLPMGKIREFTTNLTDSGSGVSITGYRLLKDENGIIANKNGIKAREVPSDLSAQISDSSSLHYATTDSPACYLKNGTVYVIPSGGSVLGVAYPTVAFGDSTIAGFPAELLEGVVLYASVEAATASLQTQIGNFSTNKDIELATNQIKAELERLAKLRTELESYLKAI